MDDAQQNAPAIAWHAAFTGGAVRFWGETITPPADPHDADADNPRHPFAASGPELLAGMAALAIEETVEQGADHISLRLPAAGAVPIPSEALCRMTGRDPDTPSGARAFAVESLALRGAVAHRALETMLARADHESGSDVRFFAMVARLAEHLLCQQRFVPMMLQDGGGKLSGRWLPWLSDERTALVASGLLASMPASARAAIDAFEHDPAAVLTGACGWMVDARCREVLKSEDMIETVEDRDGTADAQIAWMQGLLGDGREVGTPGPQRTEATRRVRRWIGSLEDRGKSADWRLLLRLNEPLGDELPENIDNPSADLFWSVSFHLQSQDDPSIVVDASDVWLLSRDRVTIEGLTLEEPQELLLAELGRAARIFKALESALEDTEPIEVLLATKKAYEFLRELRPLLAEQGFGVEFPGWWDSPAGRLGARLRIESDPLDSLLDPGAGARGGTAPQLGLSALVGYHWEIALGDTTLTLKEFEDLASKGSPLVRIGGRWIEVRPEDVKSAIEFIRENPGGEMALAEAMRLAYSTDPKQIGLPILGLQASGWVASILGGSADQENRSEEAESRGPITVPLIETPDDFQGTLRPYQQRGLSWMAFLERFGFGGCLADDMGLGKTVQLLALLVAERSQGEDAPHPKPTLLIVPMSVVGNWVREARRFAPQLRFLVHHGIERLMGDDLLRAVAEHDVIVTTYALANRDKDILHSVHWGRVVVDEAQFIKNPQAKQSLAVRGLNSERRMALTGTPVENRLSELWSIMDFLNPGYLGPSGTFRKRFSVPIERYRDAQKAEQLRGLVRPFILRRVKTDPAVAADLPEKLETREYTHLSSEQAALYESCVNRMLSQVEESEGIQRRGLVLAALIRLKQICNHPAQMLKDHDFSSGKAPDPVRSGKCVRLLEMLDEVLAEGDRALLFTQFRQMGHLLSAMLKHELGRDVLFLHGGTPQKRREELIDKFQDEKGTAPILILSLKAGGVGLNLTAATHVFHFDRWWNPAVENQATDRAYRIGQTRTVHVHKFIVRGTLEERIDEMIEAKTELAEQIVGAGERWLTELGAEQLRDLLTLRADALGDELAEEASS